MEEIEEVLNITKNSTDSENSSFNETFEFNWMNISLLVIYSTIITSTLIGNTLVIVAVLTTKRLRTVTNCFVMSLAVADWLVGIFVMPLKVVLHVSNNRWNFGTVICKIWITLDVMLCTSSILSLCIISIDRYFAITRPLSYSRKRRTKRLALLMISCVWVISIAITTPSFYPWSKNKNTNSSEIEIENNCSYEDDPIYVIYSALGSFFLPLLVMIYVYGRIACVIATRHKYIHKDGRDEHEDILTQQDIRSNLTPSSSANSKSNFQFTSSFISKKINKSKKPQETSEKFVEIQSSSNTLTKRGENRKIHDESDSTTSATESLENEKKEGKETMNIPGSRICNYQLSSLSPPLKKNRKKLSENIVDEKVWTVESSLSSFSLISPHSHSTSIPSSSGISHINHNKLSTSQSCNLPGKTLNDSFKSNPVNQKISKSSAGTCRVASFKRENKAAQTLGAVVGGFVICWLPFFIAYVIGPFIKPKEIPNALMEFFVWLGWGNSAINPAIYAFYNPDFRSAFWRLTMHKFTWIFTREKEAKTRNK